MCVPINQASNFLFYFHSDHMARKIITNAYAVFWGCFGADGLVSQKQGTYLGLSSAKLGLGCPRNWGRAAKSDSTCNLAGGLCFRGAGMGPRGRVLEALPHQMSDAALTNRSVLFVHRQGHGCGKHVCGGFMVRRPDRQALGRPSANVVKWEMSFVSPVPPFLPP